MTVTALLFALIALAAGAALGWLLGSRPAADLRARLAASEGAGKDSDTRFRQSIAELGEAQIKLATLEANAASFAEQKAGLLTAQDSLKREFEAAGAKILTSAQEALMTRADARFASPRRRAPSGSRPCSPRSTSGSSRTSCKSPRLKSSGSKGSASSPG